MGPLRESIEANARNGGLITPLCSPGGSSCDALAGSSGPDELSAQLSSRALSIGHVYAQEGEKKKDDREDEENKNKEGGGFGFQFNKDTKRPAVQALARTVGSACSPNYIPELLHDQVRKRSICVGTTAEVERVYP